MNRTVTGHVNGLLGEGLYGWACVPDVPEQRLWVELLVDDCPVGIARAENHHPEAPGDGCYGFWLPLPPVLRDASGLARVRVANTAQFVEPALTLSSVKKSALLGAVSSDMGLTVSGWVRDPAEPERVLHVSAWLEDKKLLEVPANERRFRPETADGHGFSLTLPLELADGLSHQVQLLDEEKRPLPGSPVLVCALPQGVADWFAAQKKVEAPQRKVLSEFLTHYEAWLPKGVRLEQFVVWRECFPLPPIGKVKETVHMVDSRRATPEALSALPEQGYVLWHQGEKLHPQAVAHLLGGLQELSVDLVYADGAVRQDDGTLLPLCRPAWDLYRFLCLDDLGPFLVRSSLIRELAALDDTVSTLRARIVLAAHERRGIRHLPCFLSEAEGPCRPDAGHGAVVQAWLHGKGADIEPQDDVPNRLRCVPSRTPLVSLLIPTRDKAALLRACLESLNTSTYENSEVLILDNASREEETHRLFQSAEQGEVCRFPVRVLRWDGVFNYAAINNFGAQEARGELLCLLNNDTEVLSPGWLEEMVGLLLTSLDGEVGAVGAKLLWPNELVQHGGVVVGTHQLAAHIGNGWIANEAGYMQLNQITRQVSAVTAACLLTPRQLFLDMGGLDAARFPVAFNDVDYCLRLRTAGKTIVWTPHAQLMHHESASRGHDVTLPQKSRAAMEMQHFRALWGNFVDPFYNPNLSLSTVLEPFAGLALPPRKRSLRS